MSEGDKSEEMARSIRFPNAIWKAIDAEAKLCRRSSVKQMEQIFALYYNIEPAEVNQANLFAVKEEMQRQSAPASISKKLIAAEPVGTDLADPTSVEVQEDKKTAIKVARKTRRSRHK